MRKVVDHVVAVWSLLVAAGQFIGLSGLEQDLECGIVEFVARVIGAPTSHVISGDFGRLVEIEDNRFLAFGAHRPEVALAFVGAIE